jgi:hypothetical protein
MEQPTQCELWLVVAASGDYACGSSPEAAREAFEESIEPLADVEAFRCIRLTVAVELPVTTELIGAAPLPAASATLAVA